MSRIIADIYEIEREIGVGGGGVVYLAKHLRLNKQVVLKGDKRSLTAKYDTLRREVDSLKNLSHTYIPQVYDYVSDVDMVYTVMDYVEGESLKNALEYGKRFEQARIVKWAGQLLEAVDYLHKQPPHGILHADIKPANIMLTPQDDIRLIDFNIALMLNEDGAVAVGRSFGYASPEHYGVDYSGKAATSESSTGGSNAKDLSENDVKTVIDDPNYLKSHSSSVSGQKQQIDIRSDIYSIGATLYHLLTGERPMKDATNVSPILRKNCSLALAAIVEKAMNPNPDLRYQSAEAMLFDIRHLRDNDPRVRRWKRARLVASVVLALTFIFGIASAFAGYRQTAQSRSEKEEQLRIMAEQKRDEEEAGRIAAENQRKAEEDARIKSESQQKETAMLRRQEEMRVLAANSAQALRNGDKKSAIELALRAAPSESETDIAYLPEAKKALADALDIYNVLDDFKPYSTVTLPSEAIDIVIAPDGMSFAAMSFGMLSVYSTENCELLAELPAVKSGLAGVKYINNDKIVFAASEGLTIYELYSESATQIGDEATTIAISADCTTIAAVNRDTSAASVYRISDNVRTDITFGNRQMSVDVNDHYGNPGDRIFSLSPDGSLLAVSFSNGGLEIFDTTDGKGFIEIYDESNYAHFEGGFFGKYFAFSAANAERSIFSVIDTKDLIETVSTSLPGQIGVFTDISGIYLSYNGTNVSIDPITAKQTPIDHDPAAQSAGYYRVQGSLNSPILRISRYESHADRVIFGYDPAYIHDEARMNSSGTCVMLFSYDHFRIYDVEGTLMNETSIPDADQVFDQQYRKNVYNSCLEVTYYDGTVRKYSGDDGTLISEEMKPAPDKSLYEEFITDNLRITSPLHGVPSAYDLSTGELIRELEKDAYLTYATQVREYVVTEYLSAEGDRYGLLLDGKTCETIAYIPNLCDIVGEWLIIDDKSSGSIRETLLYLAEELVELAQATLKEY